MKVSLTWLKQLVRVDRPVAELAHALTMGGLEVEEITPAAAPFTGIVVAHVKSVAPHPNADKLRVTEVDAGTGETLQIVCGAPNVAAGQKVPCALIGAVLPSGDGTFEIKKAKLRGVESNGMLCSARELGLSDDHAGLLVLSGDTPVGEDIRKVLDLDDVVLTLKLTPNRGDCLSMAGIARDTAALTGAVLALPKIEAVAATIADRREIRLTDDTACSRYCGRIIRGIDAKAKTPAWLARRLERAGLRPRSPLVDITNYVMLERGQPMHAFDNDKLSGAIDVRFARAGEEMNLLVGEHVKLDPAFLLVTDGKGPVALGGVMGGLESMVTDATTNVFFEAAFFDPAAIQGRARKLGLTSDAAYRFERGVDFAGARAALELATRLTLEICGGAAGPVTEAVGKLPGREPVRVRPARVQALLGYPLSAGEVASSLERLACKVEKAGEEFSVTPPSWRFDLAIEEDYAEEVARLLGYERVPADAPRSSVPMLAPAEGRKTRFTLRHALAARGYFEAINYSFVSEDWERDFAGNANPVRLANPIASQMGVMRSSLIAGLVATLRENLNRDEARVRLFEIGRCFLGETPDFAAQPERIAGIAYGSRVPEQWGEKAARIDFYDVKGDLEALVASHRLEFVAAAHPALHPGRCAEVRLDGKPIGHLGELHPRLLQQCDLPQPAVVFELASEDLLVGTAPAFAGISRMPTLRRDLAIVVDEGIPAGVILAGLRGRVPALVREVEVFDLYRGSGIEPGKKSVALRVVMQDTDRTLTDSEVDAVVSDIRSYLNEQFSAQLRT
jgi:phenylalanyl-tRNA synthetase beta chain